MNHCDWIVFADESGDHSLTKIDPKYPVFVLSFCVFRKDLYAEVVVPAITKFKFKYFGHDHVILHSREIKKRQGPFVFLNDKDVHAEFMKDLSALMASFDYKIIATVIKKSALTAKYRHAENPYNIALQFCVERLGRYIDEQQQRDRQVTILSESRGGDEDKDLELAFLRICHGGTEYMSAVPRWRLVLASKKCNSPGLQIADLVSNPIGNFVVHGNREDRAFQIIEPKLLSYPNGKYQGKGLKIFP